MSSAFQSGFRHQPLLSRGHTCALPRATKGRCFNLASGDDSRSDAWKWDRPPGSVKLLMCRLAEHLVPAPVAAIGLELINVMVWRTDTERRTIGESAATSNRCTKIRIARAPTRVMRVVQQGGSRDDLVGSAQRPKPQQLTRHSGLTWWGDVAKIQPLRDADRIRGTNGREPRQCVSQGVK